MVACKFSLCFLPFVAFLAISGAVQTRYQPTTNNQIRVAIEKSNNMSPSMELDASDSLKRAYSLSTSGDRCSIFRQLFEEKYPEYTWHVVLYKAYSIQYVKSIDLKVDNDHYLLFATKK